MAQLTTVSSVWAAEAACLERPKLRPSWMTTWFAALLAVTVVVRVADPTGWLGADDLAYFTAAEHVLAGEKVGAPDHHAARAAVVLPVALSVWLFGKTAWAVALPMAVASTLCVVLVAFLGRLLWGWWEGLFAASVVSVLPFFRVLSTTAYTDAHACLWATLAMVLAVVAAGAGRSRSARPFSLACGLALGLAASAKVFSMIALVGVLGVFWAQVNRRRQERIVRLSWVALGGLIYFLADALFYAWAADDFWYKLHSLTRAQANDPVLARATYGTFEQSARLVWDRATLLLRPMTSGWGILALGFWPAALLVLVLDRPRRGIAAWAIATYLLVAFMPFSFKNGIHPYPEFAGRQILTACVPFALCFAWLVHRLARLVLRPAWINGGWPIVLLIIVGTSYANPNELRAFRHRRTQRVGLAIKQIIAATDWDDDRMIVMTPALYLRHRILFPAELRSRLRVVADETGPAWWREEGDMILSRHLPMPAPSEAYLIATPSQLDGQPEWWDYEVGLPEGELEAWRSTAGGSPLVRIGETPDGTVGPMPLIGEDARPLLLLLAGEPVRQR